MANRFRDADAVIQIWDRHLIDCIPESSRVTLPLALVESWLFSYGWPIIESTLEHAIDLWHRKCAREELPPAHDLVYLRNYLRSEKNRQLTKAAS
jgi:hypothetical protein